MRARPTEPGLPSEADPLASLSEEHRRRLHRLAMTLPQQQRRLQVRLEAAEVALTRIPSGSVAGISVGWAVESLRCCLQVTQICTGLLEVDAALERVALHRELYAIRLDAASSYAAAHRERQLAEAAAARAEHAAEAMRRARVSPWVACAFMAGAMVGGALALAL